MSLHKGHDQQPGRPVEFSWQQCLKVALLGVAGAVEFDESDRGAHRVSQHWNVSCRHLMSVGRPGRPVALLDSAVLHEGGETWLRPGALILTSDTWMLRSEISDLYFREVKQPQPHDYMATAVSEFV